MINYIPAPQETSSPSEGCSERDIPSPVEWAKPKTLELTRRYPKEGFIDNTDTEIIAYIAEGRVLFEQDDEHVCLDTGATVTIKTGVSYAWTPKDSVKIFTVRHYPAPK